MSQSRLAPALRRFGLPLNQSRISFPKSCRRWRRHQAHKMPSRSIERVRDPRYRAGAVGYLIMSVESG
jgi:hypothetical protein